MEQSVRNPDGAAADSTDFVLSEEVIAILPTISEDQKPAEAAPEGSDEQVEQALQHITEAARTVGGFKTLAEIAAELDRAGVGCEPARPAS
jgi:hypothetical protein